ncbi:MAG: hypothetical protein IJX26_00810 [Clostridia bacterium]|nr:hypothetical protein [Clostridia bacterium]
MDIKGKRILSVICYYTLIGLSISMAVAFIFALSFRTYPMWAKVIYYIWGGVAIATIIFDICCTAMNKRKFISGMLVYVLSVASIAMAIILYLINTTKTGLPLDFSPMFTLITVLSFAVSLFMIAQFIVGESTVEHNTSAKSLKQRGIKE